MSKEETLKKSLNNSIWWRPVLEENVYSAMDEYAKQEAIGFAEWIIENEFQVHPDKSEYWGKLTFENGRERIQVYTSSELYTIYQQTKDNGK